MFPNISSETAPSPPTAPCLHHSAPARAWDETGAHRPRAAVGLTAQTQGHEENPNLCLFSSLSGWDKFHTPFPPTHIIRGGMSALCHHCSTTCSPTSEPRPTLEELCAALQPCTYGHQNWLHRPVPIYTAWLIESNPENGIKYQRKQFRKETLLLFFFPIKDLWPIGFTEMCLFYSKIKAFILDKQNTNNLIAAIVTHKKV